MPASSGVQIAPNLRVRPRQPAVSWEKGARRKRSVSKQSEAAIARVLIVAVWMRNRRHSPVRFRVVGTRPDVAFQ